MPRTIEHKIKLIGSTTPSTNISEYGSIERQKNLSNFDNKISQSKGTGSHSANIKADEISYGTESFERRLHYSPNEIEREQFSCRKFGERCCLGGDGDSKVKFQDNYKTTAEAIHPINHKYDNSDPFTHPMHKDEEWDVFEGDDDISIKNGTKGSERGLPRQSPSKQLENKPIKIKNSKNEKTSKFIQNNPKNNQFYQNNYFPNNIQSPPTMKRVIKKSRLVSIYDGRPMSDFVETVHYEPVENNYYNKYSQVPASPLHISTNLTNSDEPKLFKYCSSCSLSEDEEENKHLKEKKNIKNNKINNQPLNNNLVYLTQNPLYSSF